MPRARSLVQLRSAVARFRGRGETVAFVPTMGALHDGHVSLVRLAKRSADRVVVSIFVNPLQFGPGEDFTRYPRTFDADLALLGRDGCDAVYAPDVADLYPDGFSSTVDVAGPSAGYEGAARPGHFRGVATVVAKLLQRARADRAYFGRKDAQQLAVIRRMVADLAVPAEIRAVETVREPDGLAVSSRNVFLSPDERRRAATLHRALEARDPAVCEGDVEYLAVVDPDTFHEVAPAAGTLVIGAARFGTTRLIDNIRLEGP
jgi:pantoate--beta-alanine ligase